MLIDYAAIANIVHSVVSSSQIITTITVANDTDLLFLLSNNA